MNKVLKRRNSMVVDIAEGILVNTTISSQQHAALRAGFARYPSNPRWNVAKFHAWKTGRQLRQALSQGEMMVRSTDSMLVKIEEGEEGSDELPSSGQLNLPVNFKPESISYQLA